MRISKQDHSLAKWSLRSSPSGRELCYSLGFERAKKGKQPTRLAGRRIYLSGSSNGASREISAACETSAWRARFFALIPTRWQPLFAFPLRKSAAFPENG